MSTRTVWSEKSGPGTRERQKQRHLAKWVRSAEMTVHPSGNWLRVTVDREEEVRDETFGVCGFSAADEPVTSFTLLGPKERITYVEWLEPDVPVVNVKVTKPFFEDRRLARIAIHVLRIWHGVPCDCVPNTECGCEFPLGTTWRWWDACEVEALHYDRDE